MWLSFDYVLRRALRGRLGAGARTQMILQRGGILPREKDARLTTLESLSVSPTIPVLGTGRTDCAAVHSERCGRAGGRLMWHTRAIPCLGEARVLRTLQRLIARMRHLPFS